MENLRLLVNTILLRNSNESRAGRHRRVPSLTGNTVKQESPESAKSGSRMDVAHSVRSVSFMDVANSVRTLPHTVTDSSVASDSADDKSEPNKKIGPG